MNAKSKFNIVRHHVSGQNVASSFTKLYIRDATILHDAICDNGLMVHVCFANKVRPTVPCGLSLTRMSS